MGLLGGQKTHQRGPRFLISVDGQIRYREYAEEVNGTTVKHRVAEIHAYKLQRLSKLEGQDDSAGEATEE